MSETNFTEKPTRETRYFLYDPLGVGLVFFTSEVDRDREQQLAIAEYTYPNELRDMSDGLKGMCSGVVTWVSQAGQVGAAHKAVRSFLHSIGNPVDLDDDAQDNLLFDSD